MIEDFATTSQPATQPQTPDDNSWITKTDSVESTNLTCPDGWPIIRPHRILIFFLFSFATRRLRQNYLESACYEFMSKCTY